MRDEYDFSKMASRKNPYAKKIKKQVTIRLGEDVIVYFKSLGEEMGIPYQSLINLYLRDCVAHNRKLSMDWKWRLPLDQAGPSNKRRRTPSEPGASTVATHQRR